VHDGSLQVSVVMATHNRPERLVRQLAALRAQTLPDDAYEVIVVDDASGPETVELLQRERRQEQGPSLHVIRRDRSGGPAAARNQGWRAAKAPLIAFTDDDCRPAPGWLAALLAAARDAGDGDFFIQGRTEVDPDEAHLLFALARSVNITEPSPWHETCNMAYPRSLLERLGGFDESFTFGGEDTDLGLRALGAGARRRFAAEALVWHAVLASSLHGTLRSVGRWETLPLVVSRHPQQRRHLFLRLFRNRSHFAIMLAALGLLAVSRRPTLTVAAAAPYVARSCTGS
jgi:GT2 family glycosyltransferase